MVTKAITFTETTKGHVVKVNGTAAWFIKKENMGWVTYRSEDGGTGFLLIPSNNSDATETWGHKTLNDAKRFCSTRELNQ